MASVLAAYERHLALERDLTPHTVRAYVADVAGLLDHAARLGRHDVTDLDLRTLRSWLAKQQTLGPVPHHDRPAGDRGPGVHRLAAPHRPAARPTPGASLGSPEGAPDAAAGAARRRGRAT